MQVTSSNSKLNNENVASPKEAISNWLVNQLAEQLSLEPENIKVSEPLTRYGLDSIDAVTLVGDLEDWLDLELPSTLFWDYPTIDESAQYLVSEHDINISDSIAESNDEVEAASEAQPEESSGKKKGWGIFGRLTGA